MAESFRAVRCLQCFEQYKILWRPGMRTLGRCVVRLGPAKKCGGILEFAPDHVKLPMKSPDVPLASQEERESLDRFLASDPELGDGENGG